MRCPQEQPSPPSLSRGAQRVLGREQQRLQKRESSRMSRGSALCWRGWRRPWHRSSSACSPQEGALGLLLALLPSSPPSPPPLLPPPPAAGGTGPCSPALRCSPVSWPPPTAVPSSSLPWDPALLSGCCCVGCCLTCALSTLPFPLASHS